MYRLATDEICRPRYQEFGRFSNTTELGVPAGLWFSFAIGYFTFKSGRDADRKILTTHDERLGQVVPGNPESIDPDGMVMNILSFELSRHHLWKFLEANDLPTLWVADFFVWHKTAILYGELFKDTPLIMSRKDYQFKYLRQAVITSCEPSEAIVAANPGQTYSGFRWEFTLNDGRTFKCVNGICQENPAD